MTANGSGPAAVATAVEARKIDQLGGLIAPPDDQRSPWARRLRDIIELHVGGLGGPEALSEAKRSLTRRASTITASSSALRPSSRLAGLLIAISTSTSAGLIHSADCLRLSASSAFPRM